MIARVPWELGGPASHHDFGRPASIDGISSYAVQMDTSAAVDDTPKATLVRPTSMASNVLERVTVSRPGLGLRVQAVPMVIPESPSESTYAEDSTVSTRTLATSVSHKDEVIEALSIKSTRIQLPSLQVHRNALNRGRSEPSSLHSSIVSHRPRVFVPPVGLGRGTGSGEDHRRDNGSNDDNDNETDGGSDGVPVFSLGRRGILAWIGTKYGMAYWQNPAGPLCHASTSETGRLCLDVKATALGGRAPQFHASCVLDSDRDSPVCFQQAQAGTNWVLDLGDSLRVQPRHYRLRDSLGEREESAASWDFDAWLGEGPPVMTAAPGADSMRDLSSVIERQLHSALKTIPNSQV